MCNDMCVDHGCMYITEKIRSNISILICGPFPRGSFLAIMGVMIEYIPRFIMYYYAWKLMERSELVMKIVEVPCFQSRPCRARCTQIGTFSSLYLYQFVRQNI